MIDPGDSDGPILVLGAHTTLTAVQMPDPEPYEAVTVPRPDFFDPDGESGSNPY